MDPIEQWRRADSGAAKAVAGNRLVTEIERLREENARLRDLLEKAGPRGEEVW